MEGGHAEANYAHPCLCCWGRRGVLLSTGALKRAGCLRPGQGDTNSAGIRLLTPLQIDSPAQFVAPYVRSMAGIRKQRVRHDGVEAAEGGHFVSGASRFNPINTTPVNARDLDLQLSWSRNHPDWQTGI